MLSSYNDNKSSPIDASRLKDFIDAEYAKRFPPTSFIPGESGVPISGQVFDQTELFEMTKTVLSAHWTDGEVARKFEEKLCAFLDRKFCLLTNSGSSASLLAFGALTSVLMGARRITPGSEVITVAVSFPTTINPIIQYGCIPVFLDVDLETLCMETSHLEEAMTSNTKALFVAHTLGNPIDLSVIADFCRRNNLWFIEDNCDALGSEYNGKKTGSFGDISTLSFYPAHHITTGEGGAVFTNNPLIAKAAKSLRDWGRDCWCPTGKDNTCGVRFSWKLGDLPQGYDHKYTFSHIGYNLKMTDIQAACGLAQIDKIDEFTRLRRRNYEYLKQGLAKHSDRIKVVSATPNSNPSWFGIPINIVDTSIDRSKLIAFLNERRIGTRLVFASNIIKQPYFIDYKINYRVVGSLKNSDYVMNNTFWVGCFPGISLEMLDWVIKAFEDFLASKKEKILITGVAGFIASHLLDHLPLEKYEVVGLEVENPNFWRIEDKLNRIKIYTENDLDRLFDENKDISCIVHLAALYKKTEASIDDMIAMNGINVIYSTKILEKAIGVGIKNFINVSTCFVYDMSKGILDEDSDIYPYNYYAVTKYNFENVLKYFSKKHNLSVINLRLFPVYGEKDNDKLFNLLVRASLQNTRLSFGPGEQRWNYVHVSDVASAIIASIEKVKEIGRFETINVGSETNYSIKEIASLIEDIAHKPLEIGWGEKPYDPNEIMDLKSNPSKITNMLNWRQNVSLREGIMKIFTFMKGQLE